MLEYLRLILFAVLLVAGLFIELTALLGVNRFRFSLNRLHSAGMGDTLGLLLIGLAGAVYAGFTAVTDEEHFEAEAKEWKP